MNKIFVLTIFLLLTINGCYNYEQLQKNIIVKQIPCNKSIILHRDSDKNTIDGIEIFYNFEVYKTIGMYDPHPSYYGYNGNDQYSGGGQLEYLIQNNKIISLEDYQKTILECKIPIIYSIRAGMFFKHYNLVNENLRKIPYSNSEKEQILQIYVDKMKQLRQDTLHIGSIAEVQRTNPKFFNYFIQGDTIILKMLDCKNTCVNKFVPIEIK